MIDILVTLLTPVVVSAAVQVAKWIKSGKFSPGTITTILIPAFTAVYTVITQNLLPGTPHWYFQAGLGLAASFIFEFLKNLKADNAAV